jgi:peptide/nickel transport system substrate-binding protein
MLNTSHGPLQDIKVRQALFHSIDRPRLAENLFFGLAKPAFGPLSSATPGYWKGVEDYYPYDPEKAAALLDEAGWTMGADGIREKDGQKLSIHYISLLEPDTAVSMQAKAKEVGIDLAVEIVTKAKQDELILSNDFDMGEIRWVFNSPSVLNIPFSSKNIPEPGKFKFNWMHWASPELDALLAKAGSAASNDEMVQAYADAQKMIMDHAAFMGVHDQVQTIAYNAKIDGLHFAPGNWQVRLYDVRPAQ